MSENWLSSEDSPCLLVCFSLLQLPLSQLCLSSVYLSCDLLLLARTPDHHITFMMDNGHSVSLSSEQNPQGHLTISSSSHHMYCPLSWYIEMPGTISFRIYSTPAFNFSTHTKISRMSTAAPVAVVPSLPPPPPGQLCLALCRLSTALRKHAWTHHYCPDR